MATDTHRLVLNLLKAGQPLKTTEYYQTQIATIGEVDIPFSVVKDLERSGLIRCSKVEHRGQQHGKHCEWEAV